MGLLCESNAMQFSNNLKTWSFLSYFLLWNCSYLFKTMRFHVCNYMNN